MKRRLRRIPWVVVSLGVFAASAFALAVGLPSRASDPEPESDPALQRTRAQAKMLDDLFKVAVVEVAEKIRERRRNIERKITVRQPAAKCAKCGQWANCGQART